MKFSYVSRSKILNPILVVLVVSSIFSCSKDDEDIPAEGFGFEYKGDFFELSEVLLPSNPFQVDHMETKFYEHDIALFSSGLEWDDFTETFNGSGHAVTFNLTTTSSDEIPEGTYQTSDDVQNFRFSGGEVTINADSSTGSATYFEIIGGSVVVSYEDDKVSFEFTFLLENYERVKGRVVSDIRYGNLIL